MVALSIREYLAADELQQRIQLTALAVAFVGTLLATFSWGFLEGIGYAPLGGFVVFAILVGFYLVGLALAHFRYR